MGYTPQSSTQWRWRRGKTPFPGYPVEEEWWRQLRHHSIQEAHSHGQISSRTLRSMLSIVKYKIPTVKQSCAVYKIPCSCGKVYLRRRDQDETAKRTQGHMQEGWTREVGYCWTCMDASSCHQVGRDISGGQSQHVHLTATKGSP